MKLTYMLSAAGLVAVMAAGIIVGIGLAVFTQPTPAWAGVFTYERFAVVSWRGGGDQVPVTAPNEGWPAPMFYATPAEGAHPEGPAGVLPTGVWAPGDTIARTLIIKNTDPHYLMQIEHLQVALLGDLGLAPWFGLTITGPDGESLYGGTLADLGEGRIALASPVLLPRGVERTLTFAVTLDRGTDQRYQGRTVKGDFVILASRIIRPMVIDVHPNSWPNPINPGAGGSIPVAINGTAELDVWTLSGETAAFGPNQIAPVRTGSYEDWNRDGFADLILHFDNASSGITCGMESVTLRIASSEGIMYEGTDAIKTTGCR